MGLPKRLTEKQIKFANLVVANEGRKTATECAIEAGYDPNSCLLYTSPSPRDGLLSRMPSSA